MPWSRWTCLWGIALGLLAGVLDATSLAADAEFEPAALEFFEKEVRPILVSRCYECHSGKAAEPKGGLRLDSREHALKGGDTAAALVPGKPKESLLVSAINYGEEYQMPPKTKMPANEIAVLTKWVELGAPWPKEAVAGESPKGKPFNLAQRKASHWCWQPIQNPPLPPVKNPAWIKSPLDAFILAKLDAKGIVPNGPAEKHSLIRRAYFDLIGLPPTPEQVAAFVNDPAPDAFAKVVDELLKSPRFGERWGRHWLDLVRYAESRGHEFDFDIPNAWQYRDYVIRALNADVPYDQFVLEHVAGDLLPKPRLNPEEKYNESVLATGFWHLGEWIHSPVDIRKDECDRFDNMVDVFSKTFQGLTVSCARCHDHKFDAISQKDYYALFGYLHSSEYRQARFDAAENNAQVAEKLRDLEAKTLQAIGEKLGDVLADDSILKDLPQYLLQARLARLAGGSSKNLAPIEELAAKSKLQRETLIAWVAAIEEAHDQPEHPLHIWAKLSADAKFEDSANLAEFFAPISKATEERLARVAKEWEQAKIVADFTKSGPLLTDGPAYGTGPLPEGEIRLARDKPEPLVAEVALFSSARFDRTWEGLRNAPGTQNDIGAVGGWNRIGKTLRTPTFEVTRPQVKYLVQGAGRAIVVVDSHRLLQGPLHGQTLKEWNDDQQDLPRWVSHDLSAYIGHHVHVEFSPKPDNDLRIAMVVNGEPPRDPLPTANDLAAQLAAPSLAKVADKLIEVIQASVGGEDNTVRSGRVARWAWQHPGCFMSGDNLANWNKGLETIAKDYHAQRDKLIAEVRWESRTAPAMWDGSGDNERLLVRGNATQPREVVPRRFLTAIVGDEAPVEGPGSGRLQLAQQLLAENNPLTARVMTNRIWHHLLGRGIVPSTDNFGVLGQAPSHPELLDHLATDFRREGWSIKRLIRTIMLSSTYQMSSTPGEADKELDPQNLLWHRANIRRLEGEVIRDQMLALSGRLNDKMFGPPVPVYLTSYMQGRGRPGGGPLDGDGRRSIYISVRRNFLSPMMLAFDTPAPFSTMGKRNVSNVPAQALTLMNDPLVVEQARLVAKRLVEDKTLATPAARVQRLYLLSFAREATPEELAAALAFLESQGREYGLDAATAPQDQRTWSDLCHVMMNVKEFIFIP